MEGWFILAKDENAAKLRYNIDMKNISAIILMAVCAGVLFVAPAKAQTLHPVLKKFQDEKQAKVEFLGNQSGLDGWLITGKNDAGADIVQYAYSTPMGGIVLGIMFGPDGEVVTVKQLEAYRERMKAGGQGSVPLENLTKGMEAPKSTAVADPALNVDKAAKAEKFYALTEGANWVQIGKKDAPYMYVFINMTCEHCLTHWKLLKKYVDDGTLALRLVPFGAVDQNRKLGAALLASPQPDKLWRDFASGNVAALTVDGATDETLKKMDRNTALFGEFHLRSGPPFSIYRAPADGKIKAVMGRPENIMMLIADFMN